MGMRFAAWVFLTVLLAACQSSPPTAAWLMQGSAPWVGPDGQCVQLRPLHADEKQGFCYAVMVGTYQKHHHYEELDPNEFAFLYPHVEPTPQSAYSLVPPPIDNEMLPQLDAHAHALPYLQELYTSLPFRFNNAHLSKRNREALRLSFQNWRSQGIKVTSVAVTGHTDSKGTQAYNLQLSRWRAQSVAYYLMHLGVPRDQIASGGAGMLVPLPNARSDADNRYVDLRVWLLPPDDTTKAVAFVYPLEIPRQGGGR